MKNIYLALGSNVGDSRANIAKAIDLLGVELRNLKQAPIYSSKAVGYTDQPDFLNTAVRVETGLSPLDLLTFVKQVEKEVGRIDRFRWGPREIDVDIIFYGQQLVRIGALTIPHPRFVERDFVLRPLSDLDPSFVDPLSRKTIKELLETLNPSDLSITYLTDR